MEYTLNKEFSTIPVLIKEPQRNNSNKTHKIVSNKASNKTLKNSIRGNANVQLNKNKMNKVTNSLTNKIHKTLDNKSKKMEVKEKSTQTKKQKAMTRKKLQ